MDSDNEHHDDPYAVTARVHGAGRRLAPVLRRELPALLGSRTPGVPGMIADWAERRRLLEPAARSAIAATIVRCDGAIRAGTTTRIDWHVARHVGGDEEWECREIEVLTDEARRVAGIREELAGIAEMIERVDDLLGAQEAIRGLAG